MAKNDNDFIATDFQGNLRLYEESKHASEETHFPLSL